MIRLLYANRELGNNLLLAISKSQIKSSSVIFQLSIKFQSSTRIRKIRKTLKTTKHNNLVKIIDIGGRETTFIYDVHGVMTSVTTPDGNTSTTEISANHKNSTSVNTLGKTSKLFTDSKGRITKKVDIKDRETTYVYDESLLTPQSEKLPVEVHYPDFVQNLSYNLNGQVISSTVTLNDTGVSMTINNSYNDIGDLISTTNAKGGTTHFNFDELGRNISSVNALSYSRSKTFDSKGNPPVSG
jgi:YD repeat-containing protein